LGTFDTTRDGKDDETSTIKRPGRSASAHTFSVTDRW
jgi:hypothetical protein